MGETTYQLNREELVALVREAREERDETATGLQHAYAAAKGYEKERDALLALVVAVEWMPDPDDMGDPDYCPWCFAAKPDGHTDDCKRETAIARASKRH